MTLARAKILCIDDDPDLLMINSSILRQAGHEVFEASTGHEGLDISRKEHPDLVLTDVLLPDISGFDVCRLIKEDPELFGTYVLLISGMETSSGSQIRGLETGADGYIVRPISAQELLARVQSMIRIKQSETALRKSMERYQILLETMNEGIFGVDIKGNTIFVNPSLLRMTGYEAEELLGENIHFILHHSRPDGTPYRREDSFVYRTLHEGLPFNISDEVLWKKDGTSFPVEYTSSPIREQDGVIGAVVVIKDITERKKTEKEIKRLNEDLERRVIERTIQLQASVDELEKEIFERKKVEKALKDSEEIFSAICNMAVDAILLMDSDDKIIYWNPAAGRMFGYPFGEVKGKNLQFLISPRRSHAEYEKGFYNFRETGKERPQGATREFFSVREDGSEFPIEISTSSVQIKGKWHSLGIIRDITERKQSEAKLHNYARQLKNLSNRLLEIQEAERRYIAQELHDEIGQSLTALKLSLENMASMPADTVVPKLGEVQTLIQEILARVRNMSLDLRPSMLDDFGLLPALLWHFDRYRSQTGLPVKFSHDGLNVRFSPGIETAVYRIVQEALTNVARHAMANEVRVLITYGQERIEISIEDNGTGFEYEQVRNAADTAGIKWMKERLALLGGHLKIDSSPGAGTRLMATIAVRSQHSGGGEEDERDHDLSGR
jgi:PAS domain S-box-containing protein